jgi:hypothetical protein
MEVSVDVNVQKYIRTGDRVTSKEDKKKRVIHYLINNKDETSFEEPVSKIKKLIVYNGLQIETLIPQQVLFN